MKLDATPSNWISLGRLLAAPILFVLILRSDPATDVAALGLFVGASLSDWVDGWWARRTSTISDLGTYLDPAADKLMLAAAFVPFCILTNGPDATRPLPHWDALPLWVLLVALGREVLVTGISLTALQAFDSAFIRGSGK